MITMNANICDMGELPPPPIFCLPILLPDDQLLHVLSYLVLSDLGRLSTCCSDLQRRVSRVHHLSTWVPCDVSANETRVDDATSIVRSDGSLDSDQSPTTARHVSRTTRCNMTLERMTHILDRFRFLTSLHLHNLSRLGGSIFSLLNSSSVAPNLCVLHLHGCRIISDEDGHALDLAGNSNRLREVSVSGTIFASYIGFTRSIALASSNLTSVTLGGFRSLTDDDVGDFMGSIQGLENFCLPNCTQVRSPRMLSVSLRTMGFSGCCRLESLPGFDCPSLQSLDLSFCALLTDETVEAIVATCKHLNALLLRGCVRLQSPRFVSRSLEVLDVEMSSKLHSLEVLCDALVTLKIGVCVSLRSLSVRSSAIRTIDASMLPLSRLKIDARSLTQLNLTGCSDLRQCNVTCACPNLQRVDVSGSHLDVDSFPLLHNHSCRKDVVDDPCNDQF